MRRTASEVIRELQVRVAKLERQARGDMPEKELMPFIMQDLREMGMRDFEIDSIKACLEGGFCYLVHDYRSARCAIVHEEMGSQRVVSVSRDFKSCRREFEGMTSGSLIF
jgi:hypothetical protein